MSRLTLDNVFTLTGNMHDVYSIYTVMSQVMHDIKSYGMQGMLSRYEDNIELYRERLAYHDFCALLGCLEHFDTSFTYDESVRLDKYIISIDTWIEAFEFDDMSREEIESLINKEYEESWKCFRKRGILCNHIDDVC